MIAPLEPCASPPGVQHLRVRTDWGERVNKLRVAINGYGVIGRRVVDAVALQHDMEVAGIADVVGDYRLRRAQSRGFAVARLRSLRLCFRETASDERRGH